jgi:hypothetical protein
MEPMLEFVLTVLPSGKVWIETMLMKWRVGHAGCLGDRSIAPNNC